MDVLCRPFAALAARHCLPGSQPLPPCDPSAWHRARTLDSGRWPGGSMLVHSRAHWLRSIALAALTLALMPGARLAAQTRQVSVESLVYDLKNPDSSRRQ